MIKFKINLKKLISALLCLSLTLILMAGCGHSEEGIPKGTAIYYLTKNQDTIVPRSYELTATDSIGQIEELLGKLSETPDDVELHRVLGEEIKVTGMELHGNQLSLTFNEEYLKLDLMKEVLTRAAVVETLTSIPEVLRVTFYVEGEPLTDARGNTIGAMTGDTFVLNPGEQINSFQEAVITLYFSNLEGDGLVMETQQVHYSSNISMEKLIIERLLAGPLSQNAKSAIPAGTQLLSVTTADDVCYVNFDDAFKNQDYEVQEAVVIYSIVDSLLTLDDISKVQISVNGDNSTTYRDKFSLSTQYEKDLSLVEGE